MTMDNGDPTHRDHSHINGTSFELLARLAVSEICKGWPVYLDNCEWRNFSSLFAPDAIISTSWSGTQSVDRFIDKCRTEKDLGVSIHHRENGTLVELRTATERAVGKMKVTITHRFQTRNRAVTEEPCSYDIECDCRMLFFCRFDRALGGWKAQSVKVIYEKDKVCPIDGKTAPHFKPGLLARFPEGYQYLGAAQTLLGYRVPRDLPVLGKLSCFEIYYWSVEEWLDGKDEKRWSNLKDSEDNVEATGLIESMTEDEANETSSSRDEVSNHDA